MLEVAREYDAEIRINPLKPTENHHKNLFQTTEQFYSTFNYLIKNTNPVVLGEPLLAASCNYRGDGCPCGITSMRINSKTPEGKVPVTPCVYLHAFKFGDLLTQDIFEIVNSEPFQTMRKRNKKIPRQCKNLDCEFIDSCRGGCAARAFLINGTVESPDPYCIKIAQAKGIAIPEFPKKSPYHEGVRVHENYLCTYIGKPV